MSKVVVARYITEEVFKIPKSLDLEDKSKVEEWWVKYNRLHIRTTDGRHLSINGEGCVDSFDYKHPSSIINGVEGVSIESAEDYGYEEEPDIEPELYDTVMERLIQFPKLDYIKKEDEESEGEKTEPEQWELKDLTPNVVEEEEEGKICITCKSFQPYSKFAETINGEFVMTNECKGCYIEEEEEESQLYCSDCKKPKSEVEVKKFTIENKVLFCVCCECCESWGKLRKPDNEEEEDIEPECYGKHCSETEGLKLCIGWNKYYCLDNKRFTENLYCNYCEKQDCYTNCVWCGENYKLTDMEYRCGGGFADKDAYGNACMFCKECVNIIEKKLEC